MKRIGILGHTFVNWAVGLDFARLVATSLREHDPGLELHVLLPIDGPWFHARTRLRALRDALTPGKARATQPTRAAIDAAVESFGAGMHVHHIDLGRYALRAACHRLGLEGLVPALKPLPPAVDTPWVGYVYDFQHRHLPQLFRPRSARRRDREFRRMLARAPSVIVNARAVADDIRQFVPEARAEVFALPFSPLPSPEWFGLTAANTGAPVIPGRYLIVCNQFWKHKDHGTVFRAFAELATSHPDVHLVCTGDTSDFRDMGYFPGLLALADELGIRPRLHVLGMVPKRQQIALLQEAAGLVQATLSEGGPGGGAAYDALSLGVPALLSDIAVNREIADEGVTFFKAGDAHDLARAMRTFLDTPQPPRPTPEVLVARGRARRAACGQVILQALEAAQRRRAA
jgi:glycosyltransferase involved in cell wall biosynthesis